MRALIHSCKLHTNLHGVYERKDNAQKVADDENVGCGLTIEVLLLPHFDEGFNLNPRNEHVELIIKSIEGILILPISKAILICIWLKMLNFY